MENALFALLAPAQDEEAACLAAVREAAARHGLSVTPEEALAIRWHMGGYDDAAKSYIGGRTQSNAYEKVPLCAALNLADTYAAHFRA